MEWKEAKQIISLEIIRVDGSYGDVVIQWELFGENVDKYVRPQTGELRLADGETQGELELTCSELPYITKSVHLTFKPVVVTDGVRLKPESEHVQICITPHRGSIAMKPQTDIYELHWPLKNDHIEFDIDRDNTSGSVRVAWELSELQNQKEHAASDSTSLYFAALNGNIEMEPGIKTTQLQIQMKNTETGPEKDIDLQIKIFPLSEGLTVTNDNIRLRLNRHNPGTVEFSSLLVEVDPKDCTEAVVKVMRHNGNQGDVLVRYAVNDVTAVAGTHYDADAMSGSILLHDGVNEESVHIPVLESDHSDSLELLVSILAVSGGAKIGQRNEGRVILLPTFVELPSTIQFESGDDADVDSSHSDLAVVLLRRHGGTRGVLSVHCATEDDSAKAGTHYVETKKDIVFEDGETSKEISVKLLPANYQNDLSFKVQLSQNEGDPQTSFVSTKLIKLAANYHPGKITFAEMKLPLVAQARLTHKTSLLLPVRRREGCDGKISAKCQANNGDAKKGVHFEMACENIAFEDKQTSGSIEITLLPVSYRNELDFVVELVNASEETVLSEPEEIRVKLLPTDIEPAGTIIMNSGSVEVSGRFPQTLLVPVKRVNGAGGSVSLHVRTVDESAKKGVHYDVDDQLVMFEDRQVEASIPVSVFETFHGEILEFVVNICRPVGEAVIGDNSQTRVFLLPTIDTNPGAIEFSESGPTSENLLICNAKKNKSVRIPVHRVGGKYGKLSSRYRTVDSSALAGVHYQSTEGTITFDDNETSKYVEVHLFPVKYRDELEFELELETPQLDKEHLGKNKLIVRLAPTDDEPCGKIALPEEDIIARPESSNVVLIPLRRFDGTGGEVSVRIKTKDVSAIDGNHYKGVDERVTFKDRQDQIDVPVMIIPERCKMPLTFSVELSSPTGGLILAENSLLNVVLSRNETLSKESTNIELQLGMEPIVQSLSANDFSEQVQICITPHRGSIAMKPQTDIYELYWPLKNDHIEFDIDRDNTSGSVRVAWELSELQNQKEHAASDSTSLYFAALNGNIEMEPGIKTTQLQIQMKNTETGPEKDIDLQIKIFPLSEGLTVTNDNIRLRLNRHNPGTVEFSSLLVEVDPKDCTEAVVKVMRHNGNQGDVLVRYAVNDVTAVAGTHYDADAMSGSILLHDGVNEESVHIPVLESDHSDSLELLVSILAVSGGAKIGQRNEGRVILLPTFVELPSTIQFESGDDADVDSSHSDLAVVLLRRHGGTRGVLSVHCATEDDSAKAGTHYVETKKDIVFEDGETSKEISVKLLPANYQNDLSFKVQLSQNEGDPQTSFVSTKLIKLAANYHPGKITFAEMKLPLVAQARLTHKTSLLLPVRRREGCDGKISAKCQANNGDAKKGVHFEMACENIAFEDKQTSGSIEITLLPVSYRNELDFVVELVNASEETVLSEPEEIRVKLLPTDIEPAGTIIMNSGSVEVSGRFPQTLLVPVKRVNGAGGSVSLHVRTVDESAKKGVHYDVDDQLVMFEDRQVEASIPVSVFETFHGEILEFVVNICRPVGEAVIGDNSQTRVFLLPTIDTNPGAIEFSESGPTSENLLICNAKKNKSVRIPVHRVGGKYGKLSSRYRTVDSSALAGVHYQSTEGTITFDDNETSKYVEVHLFPVRYRDELEFELELETPQLDKEHLGKNKLIVRLAPTDDEPCGKIALPEEDIIARPESSNVVLIPLRRFDGTGGEVSVRIKTKDGSAIDGNHYKGVDERVTFKDRQDQIDVPVMIIPERCKMPLTFSVELSSPTGGLILAENSLLNVVLSRNETLSKESTNIELQLEMEPIVPSFSCSSDSKFDEGLEQLVEISTPAFVSVSSDDPCVYIPIKRPPNQTDATIAVTIKTKSGSAKPGKHYIDTDKEVYFFSGEEKKVAQIDLIKSKHTKQLNFTAVVQHKDDIFKVKVFLKPISKEPPGKLEFKQSEFKFSSPTVAGVNDVAAIAVRRKGGSGGKVEVDYSCRDNTAIAGKHYVDIAGKLIFDDGEVEKFISVQMLPQVLNSLGRNFFLELGAVSGGAEISGIYETEVTLEAPLDENDPGMLGFDSPNIHYASKALRNENRKDLQVLIPLRRTYGSGGLVGVDYSLRDNTAIAEKHYIDQYGELMFDDKEVCKSIPVKLLPGKHFTKPVVFTAELGGTTGGAEVGVYETVVMLDPDVRIGSSEGSSSESISPNSSSSSNSSFDEERRQQTIITESVFTQGKKQVCNVLKLVISDRNLF